MAEYKEGDWTCTACGDHQFARNTECRRCGTVRPVMSNNRQISKPGDWICPNPECMDLQFGRNAECRRCGTPKPEGGGGGKGRQEFDYNGGGGGCGRLEYGRGREPERFDDRRSGGAGRPSMQEGDWLCPACGDHQFARNTQCRRCGGDRPAEAGADHYGRDRMERYDHFDRRGSRDTDDGYRPLSRGRFESLPTANHPDMKEGDWLCPSCGDHQFARNTTCRRCGNPRPDEDEGSYGKGGARKGGYKGRDAPYSAFGGGGGGGGDDYGDYGGKGAPRGGGGKGKGKGGDTDRGDYKPGDWTCPQCGDHQFMRNEACRRCGAAKPAAAAVQNCLKPGDWFCPNPECRDMQFARNLSCRKCGTMKPDEAEEEEVVDMGRSRSPRR